MLGLAAGQNDSVLPGLLPYQGGPQQGVVVVGRALRHQGRGGDHGQRVLDVLLVCGGEDPGGRDWGGQLTG